MMYVGIDGGGTHSRLLAEDGENNRQGPFLGRSTNMASNTPESVGRHLETLFAGFFHATGTGVGDVAACCIGSAGVDLPHHVQEMEHLLRGLGLECPLCAVNDAEIVLESETGDEGGGIVLIAGTGSVCYGKDRHGFLARAGGWGHLVGDEGSAYWTGKEAVRRSLHSLDGRERPTALTELLQQHLELEDIAGVLDYVYGDHSNKSQVAQLSRLVDRAYSQGDLVAADIYRQAVSDLAAMVHTVQKQLSLGRKDPIVVGGGLIKGSDHFRRLLMEQLLELSHIVRETGHDPCIGALNIAKKLSI